MQDACDYPRTTASTEKHGQTVHKKSAKHELLIKTCPDKCIENSENHKLGISSGTLDLTFAHAQELTISAQNQNTNLSCGRSRARMKPIVPERERSCWQASDIDEARTMSFREQVNQYKRRLTHIRRVSDTHD